MTNGKVKARKELGGVASIGIALVALWLLGKKAEAAPEKATLLGKVTDANTGLPVKGVKVAVDGFFGMTDSSGNYRIPELEPKFYTGLASKGGYQDYYF